MIALTIAHLIVVFNSLQVCFNSEPVVSSGIFIESLGYIEAGEFYLNPIISDYEVSGDSILIAGRIFYAGKPFSEVYLYSVSPKKRRFREFIGGRRIFQIKEPLSVTVDSLGNFAAKLEFKEKILLLPYRDKCLDPMLLGWSKCKD